MTVLSCVSFVHDDGDGDGDDDDTAAAVDENDLDLDILADERKQQKPVLVARRSCNKSAVDAIVAVE